MNVYQETQESLAALLERAARDGAIRIQRSNGQVFVLQPDNPKKSPFEVTGVDLHLDAQQIVEFVHAGRREQP